MKSLKTWLIAGALPLAALLPARAAQQSTVPDVIYRAYGSTMGTGDIVTEALRRADANFTELYARAGAGPATVSNKTAAYTLQPSDNGSIIVVTAASAVVVTVAASLPAGFNAVIVQGGAGQVSVAAASGATVVNRQGQLKLAGQNATGSVLVTANGSGTAAAAIFSGDTSA